MKYGIDKLISDLCFLTSLEIVVGSFSSISEILLSVKDNAPLDSLLEEIILSIDNLSSIDIVERC